MERNKFVTSSALAVTVFVAALPILYVVEGEKMDYPPSVLVVPAMGLAGITFAGSLILLSIVCWIKAKEK